MCAIAGIIGLKTDESIRKSMLATMRRRGPDAQGAYAHGDTTLLHARLAIIDLEGGKQPMELDWAGEHYVLSYNGELYNTDILRRELAVRGHSFRGHSDTEVVLHAYAEYGAACLDKLNGIFAFGVWEEKRGCLFLARDRIGVKPLFYKEHEKGLLFASEIKTILKYPGKGKAGRNRYCPTDPAGTGEAAGKRCVSGNPRTGTGVLWLLSGREIRNNPILEAQGPGASGELCRYCGTRSVSCF